MTTAQAQLARRLGVHNSAPAASVHLTQCGVLRSAPDARWMRFTARQIIRTNKPAFRWRAKVGPLGVVQVRDELWDGRPAGSARLLGLLPLARAKPSVELLQGELMRYLAELPWVPDALLANPKLYWERQDKGRLTVSAEMGGGIGKLDFLLDASGLPIRVEGERPRQEGSSYYLRPWWVASATTARFREGRYLGRRRSVGWWTIAASPFGAANCLAGSCNPTIVSDHLARSCCGHVVAIASSAYRAEESHNYPEVAFHP